MKLQVVKVDTTWFVVNPATKDTTDYLSWESAMISANRRVKLARMRRRAIWKAQDMISAADGK